MDNTTDTTVETPAPLALNDVVNDLSPAEYTEHRLGGKSLEDIVKARPAPEKVDPATDADKPDNAGRSRDEHGRFASTKSAEAAKPVVEAAKPSKEGNPRFDPNAKINELTGKWRTAERERDELKARLEALERGEKPAPVAKPEPVAPTEDFPEYAAWVAADPKRQDLADPYAAWLRAANKHDREQEQQHAEREKQKSERQQSEAAAYQTHYDRLVAFRKEHPDYDDLVQRSPITKTPPPPHIGEAIVTSEVGPALQYHYLQHPDEFQALLGMSPAAAARAIGRVEASLSAASTVTAPAPKPTTQADAPFETVGASASASTRSLEAAAKAGDTRRYEELRRQQIAKGH